MEWAMQMVADSLHNSGTFEGVSYDEGAPILIELDGRFYELTLKEVVED